MILRTFALVLAVGACAHAPAVKSAHTSPSRAFVEPTEVRVEVPGRVTFELESHGLANLVYQLDCLAERMPCSTAAYRALWREQLGWTASDDVALERWKHLREHFGGELHDRDRREVDTPLLTTDGSFELGDRQRWAGLEARDATDFGRLVDLVSAVGDAERLVVIVRRFEPRFEPWWASVAPDVIRFVGRSAELVRQPAIERIVSQAARFYESDLPLGLRAPIHFVVRPTVSGNEETHGEMLDGPSVVEILAGEKPEERMSVVLHELFHVFFAHQSPAVRARLLETFAAQPEPHALAAEALLDEALATALGNGLVDAVLEPEQNARSRARVRGLYGDDAIDAAARGLLRDGFLDHALLDGSVTSREFVRGYVQGAASAFPGGVKPIDTLRAFAAASSDALAAARRDLRKAARAHDASTWTPVGAEVARAAKEHPRQSMALFVTRAELGSLEPIVPASTLERIRGTAGPGFVDATARGPGSYLYVFVAPEVAAAQRLVQVFAAKSELFEVTLRE